MKCPYCDADLKMVNATAKSNIDLEVAGTGAPAVGSVSKFGHKAAGKKLHASVSNKMAAYDCPTCKKAFVVFTYE